MMEQMRESKCPVQLLTMYGDWTCSKLTPSLSLDPPHPACQRWDRTSTGFYNPSCCRDCHVGGAGFRLLLKFLRHERQPLSIESQGESKCCILG